MKDLGVLWRLMYMESAQIPRRGREIKIDMIYEVSTRFIGSVAILRARSVRGICGIGCGRDNITQRFQCYNHEKREKEILHGHIRRCVVDTPC